MVRISHVDDLPLTPIYVDLCAFKGLDETTLIAHTPTTLYIEERSRVGVHK